MPAAAFRLRTKAMQISPATTNAPSAAANTASVINAPPPSELRRPKDAGVRSSQLAKRPLCAPDAQPCWLIAATACASKSATITTAATEASKPTSPPSARPRSSSGTVSVGAVWFATAATDGAAVKVIEALAEGVGESRRGVGIGAMRLRVALVLAVVNTVRLPVGNAVGDGMRTAETEWLTDEEGVSDAVTGGVSIGGVALRLTVADAGMVCDVVYVAVGPCVGVLTSETLCVRGSVGVCATFTEGLPLIWLVPEDECD